MHFILTTFHSKVKEDTNINKNKYKISYSMKYCKPVASPLASRVFFPTGPWEILEKKFKSIKKSYQDLNL